MVPQVKLDGPEIAIPSKLDPADVPFAPKGEEGVCRMNVGLDFYTVAAPKAVTNLFQPDFMVARTECANKIRSSKEGYKV
jgi:hypothetical protein